MALSQQSESVKWLMAINNLRQQPRPRHIDRKQGSPANAHQFLRAVSSTPLLCQSTCSAHVRERTRGAVKTAHKSAGREKDSGQEPSVKITPKARFDLFNSETLRP